MNSQKILSSSTIAAWHESIAQANGTVAVVMGKFDILQPVNLSAIRYAKQQANHVCVVIEPHESSEVCAEFVSFLRDVSASFVIDADGHGFQQLKPYILVDYAVQKKCSPLRRTARDMAETIKDISSIKNCFTREIPEKFRASHTPVNIPPDSCDALPAREDLDRLVMKCRKSGQCLVTVNGCFDILHLGHVRMLSQAREMGDELVVLVNDDASVRSYKGPSRPIFPIHFRLQVLNALTPVSLAYPFSGDNPLSLLSLIHPGIHVKGGSFKENRVHQERELIESWGGRLAFCPMVKGYSTSHLIQRTTQE